MKVRRLLEIITLLLLAVLVFAYLGSLAQPKFEFEPNAYCVEKGDCLWKIASKYCPNEMDKREYIDLIAEANNLSSSIIQPGQILTVFIVKGA